MAEPFIGEIQMWGCNYAPKNWAFCNGTIISINDQQTLFALLGDTYGGDGRSTFALPDLRGRVPLHRGTYAPQGTKAGLEQVTIKANELAAHNHPFNASGDEGTAAGPANTPTLAKASTKPLYSEATSLTALSADTLTNTGGNGSHENMQPTLVTNFCIAMLGLFPGRN